MAYLWYVCQILFLYQMAKQKPRIGAFVLFYLEFPLFDLLSYLFNESIVIVKIMKGY